VSQMVRSANTLTVQKLADKLNMNTKLLRLMLNENLNMKECKGGAENSVTKKGREREEMCTHHRETILEKCEFCQKQNSITDLIFHHEQSIKDLP